MDFPSAGASIDARIQRGVWLVLAAAACGHANHPMPLEPAPEEAPPAPLPAQSIAVAVEPPEAGAPPDRPVDAGPQRPDAHRLCRTYLSQALAAPVEEGSLSAGPLGDGTVVCNHIVKTTESMHTMMVAGTCCGKQRGGPCPSSPASVRRTVQQIDHLVLDANGVLKSTKRISTTHDDIPAGHVCGRRPEGFVETPRHAVGLGATFASMAELEAASVHAFARLAEELAALGAPVRLVARARAAQRDEVRHARTMGALARAEGAEAVHPERPVWSPRTALEMARENAIEGCVFETYGAAVASLQAARSPRADVRAAMARIAVDERAHAALAWDVDAWLRERLDQEDRISVQHAYTCAVRNLHASLSRATDDGLGGPSPAEARLLADACFGAVEAA
ncbi:MAG: hypothetical protein HOO96_41390 [Polyangiaceae bacterium]|nr:hypothetical protein [Polyangiaceae bacterium]